MAQWLDTLCAAAMLVFLGLAANRRFSIWRKVRYHGYRHWPIYPANVRSCDCEMFNSQKEGSSCAEIAYTYIIDGEYHSGYYKEYFSSEDQLDSFLDAFPIDSTINVHVNPRKPDESVFTGQS